MSYGRTDHGKGSARRPATVAGQRRLDEFYSEENVRRRQMDERIKKLPQWAQHEFQVLQCINKELQSKVDAVDSGIGPIIHDPFHHPLTLPNAVVRFGELDARLEEGRLKGVLRVSACMEGLFVLPRASNVVLIGTRKAGD